MSTSFELEPRPIEVTNNNKLLIQEIGTKKQKLFVERYLESGNVYKSALQAGYSESTALNAHATILKSPWIQKELRRRRTEWFQREERNSEWAIEEMGILAGANMADYGYVDDKGHFQVDLSRCTKEMMACIQEVTYDANGNQRIKLIDKKASLELYAKVRGVFDANQSDEEEELDVMTYDSILRKVRQAKSTVTINNQYILQNQSSSQERHQLPETIEAK